MASRRQIIIGAVTLVAATIGVPLGAVGAAGAATAPSSTTVPKAVASSCAATNRGQLRFDLARGVVQICDRAGKAYAYRLATSVEARRPYARYFQPLVGASYVEIAPATSSQVVRSVAGLFRTQDMRGLFAGFASSGLRATSTATGVDALMVVMPYTKNSKKVIDAAKAQAGEATATISGKTLVVTPGAFVYYGSTSVVLFAQVSTADLAKAAIGAWLGAHPAS